MQHRRPCCPHLLAMRAGATNPISIRPMRTLNLQAAAQFLHMNPEELRQRAKAGKVPAAKVGRRWVFLEEDLAAYVRSLYPQARQALQVTLRKEMQCHFANAAVSGGSTSLLPTGSEYAELLRLPTKPKRKNFTTG